MVVNSSHAVVHTAAALSMAIRQTPTLAADVNLGGTVNLLEASRTCGVRRFVLASSTTLYYPTFRRPQTSPIREDFAFHAVSERPGSLYAASKMAAEFFTQHYADQFGLSVAILRYSAVLGLWAGPNNSVPGRLLATLLGQDAVNGRVAVTDPLLLWAGGDDFIDARDVAAANVAALDATALPSRVYTIGSGQLATFADFVAAARQVRPALAFDEVALPDSGFAGFPYRRTQPFDVSCARAELGFAARHDLRASFSAASARVSP
jgi:UDP-glucose 4-epimerase